MKIAYFSKQHYCVSFCGLKVSGASVSPYPQVFTSTMLLLLMLKIDTQRSDDTSFLFCFLGRKVANKPDRLCYSYSRIAPYHFY